MAEEKKCPKCPNSPVMTRTDRVLVIPNLTRKSDANLAVNLRDGAPVEAYECPSCHLIELYHVDMNRPEYQ